MNNDTERTSQSNKLHGKSWEIEILISGGAFFSLYQLSNFFNVLLGKLATNDPLDVFPLAIIIGGMRMLSVYFVIQLSARAFWLSLILLQKIYPQGINVERLSLAEPFKSITTRFDLEERIIAIDRLSGLIFSWAVTFVIIFFGMGIAFFLGLIPANLLVKNNPDVLKNIWWRMGLLIIPLSLLIFLIDTFFYGIIRRSRFLSKFYYPVFQFWNTICLGFLWRPSLQLIFSNVKNRWKTSIGVLLLTLLVGFMTGDEDDFIKMFDHKKNKIEKTIVEEMRYFDKRRADESGGSFIQSDIITDNYLKIFVNYNSYDDKQIDSLKPSEKYFSHLIKLSIDDSLYLSTTWIAINRAGGQKGIQTVLDISHLDKKIHVLKIERNYDKVPLLIPFWKQ